MPNKRPSSIKLLAFGLGAGYSPVAPGTMGTLVAVPLYLLLEPLSLFEYLGVVFAISVMGIWICGWASEEMGVHDHPGIVWDEIAGYLVTMIAAPSGWPWVVAGFVLFRFFDILKPWPIGAIDKHVHGGLGIMLDDILAGLFSLLLLQGAAALIL
ncbi:MAG: phosphatidylglycerophosphatase A [Candidatus Polarisedimenticolaceae bacterium]|nr:phosphatidylglycerophosphatase A [Candidatus Polarisedimenticolaceae bacterium]